MKIVFNFASLEKKKVNIPIIKSILFALLQMGMKLTLNIITY